MDKFTIPQHLDEPARVILWTVDEVITFIVPFMLFLFVIDAPLTGLIFSSGMSFMLRKLKGECGYQKLYQLVYWYFPPVLALKATPPSNIRNYIG